VVLSGAFLFSMDDHLGTGARNYAGK